MGVDVDVGSSTGLGSPGSEHKRALVTCGMVFNLPPAAHSPLASGRHTLLSDRKHREVKMPVLKKALYVPIEASRVVTFTAPIMVHPRSEVQSALWNAHRSPLGPQLFFCASGHMLLERRRRHSISA